MKFIFIFLFSAMGCSSYAQRVDPDRLSIDLIGREQSIQLNKLFEKGVDTILCYSSWSISENLSFAGSGFIAWKQDGHCILRTLHYVYETEQITIASDMEVSHRIIDRFFRLNNTKIIGKNFSRSDHGADSYIKMFYGKAFWQTELESYELYSRTKSKGLKWVISLDELLSHEVKKLL